MNRIGLALSGGGFRATLYHLGLIRFLRDADILSQVTHITSVSGGSIFAARLALNWDRYSGSPSEFDAAASELLAVVRLDVRNRITRRFPLCALLRWPLRLLGVSNRRLTRTGLLEYHYEKYLYGDTSLFELPEKPQFHILATNLSEGSLSSFSREGLLIVRRAPGNTFRIDHIPIGLATVPMAVAASSAFPGFFPPLELTGADVGASVGEFGRQAYTDGGVFDNLGMRIFRFLERSILADHPLSSDDFFDLPAVWQALHEASTSSEETPLRRLAQVLVEAARSTEETPLNRLAHVLVEESSGPGSKLLADLGTSSNVAPPRSAASEGDRQQRVFSSLSDVMRHYQFFHEPLFARLKLVDPAAEELLRDIQVEGRIPNATDQLWLNRHLLEAAFRGTTGQACFRRLNSGLDGVIVSDVGKPIEVKSGRRAGGLIRTALRSSDILMDRVWQLEQETFRNTPGFVFVPITAVVEATEDPTAMHPEVQRQMANVRTDLDRFSPLEISSLVRHGYCVGRKACGARPDLFGGDLPRSAPWDPTTPTSRWAARAVSAGTRRGGHSRAPVEATVEARTLQASALRRIWSSLFDPRDWTSYVYLPLLVAVFILLPTSVYRYYRHGQQNQKLIEWLYQGNPDLGEVKGMLEVPPSVWPKGSGATPQEQATFSETAENYNFKFVKDTRIIDLRLWNPMDVSSSMVESIREVSAYESSPGTNTVSLELFPKSSDLTQVRFPPQQLQPKLFKTPDAPGSMPGERTCIWGATYDFTGIPKGQIEEMRSIDQSPGLPLGRTWTAGQLEFHVLTDTAQLSMWILMPTGRDYGSWFLTRTHKQVGTEPVEVESVRPIQEFGATDYTIIGFQLISLKPGETYQVHWTYQ
jgi:predicted acylesterase/phospholipase RssA